MHEKIIATLGGYRMVAEELNLHPTTVFKWMRAGIPTRHWTLIVALGKAQGRRGITYEKLAEG